MLIIVNIEELIIVCWRRRLSHISEKMEQCVPSSEDKPCFLSLTHLSRLVLDGNHKGMLQAGNVVRMDSISASE